MFAHIRRRRVMLAALVGACFAALGVTIASSHAGELAQARVATGAPVELAMSNLNTPAGRVTQLKAGVHYKASAFPIALRVTPPDGTWAGTQWKTSSHGKPSFGWVAFAQGATDAAPQGIIEIETAYGPTPPVAAILARIRSAGGGATFAKTSRVTLAGFCGWQIDGKVYGRFGHVFVPFTPRTGGASPADSYKLDPGEAFRVVVLDVKGQRLVLILDSAGLPADQFPSFLTSATQLLKSLEFPS